MKEEIYNLIFSFHESEKGKQSLRVVKRIFPDETMTPCVTTEEGVKHAVMTDVADGEYETVKAMPAILKEAKNARKLLIEIPETEEGWILEHLLRAEAGETEEEKPYTDFASYLSLETGNDVEIVYLYDKYRGTGSKVNKVTLKNPGNK